MTRTMTTLMFACGLLLSGATALAQSTEGSLHGTVLDPSGALIPQAQITVSNADGFSRTLTSDDHGAFALEHLAAGSYTVSINATGFTPALEGISVSSEQVTREEVTLGISVAQEIEVDAVSDVR